MARLESENQLSRVTVLNSCAGISSSDLEIALRAINRQMREHLWRYWRRAVDCRTISPDTKRLSAAQGAKPVVDGVIALVETSSVEEGLHLLNAVPPGVSIGMVLTDQAPWTVALSHELLEMAVDPSTTAFVPGPDPSGSASSSWLLHALEICDPVATAVYSVDGIAVSDFVTPAYFALAGSEHHVLDELGLKLVRFGRLPGASTGAWHLGRSQWLQLRDDRRITETHHSPRSGNMIRPVAGSTSLRCEAALERLRASNLNTVESALIRLPCLARQDRKRRLLEHLTSGAPLSG